MLLIEAGGLNEDAAHLTGAQRFETAFRPGSPWNWGYKTQPQWKGQEVDYSRGKGLGGSTAINFCAWVVGADEDYDEWARAVGDEAFAWQSVKRTLQRVEAFHNDVPEDYRRFIKPQDEGLPKGQPSYTVFWHRTVTDVCIHDGRPRNWGRRPSLVHGRMATDNTGCFPSC